MITKVIHAIFNTDSLPVVGGAAGALTQIKNAMFPSFETIIYTICIALIGASVGYIVKLLLDVLFKKLKDRNWRNNGH